MFHQLLTLCDCSYERASLGVLDASVWLGTLTLADPYSWNWNHWPIPILGTRTMTIRASSSSS